MAGDFVVDQEHSTGLADGSTLDTLVLSRVRDGQIVECWMGYCGLAASGEHAGAHEGALLAARAPLYPARARNARPTCRRLAQSVLL